MTTRDACQRCGHATEILRNPLRRLKWTKHWRYAMAATASHPLRSCPSCGAMYRYDGKLLAAGATETIHETQIAAYRDEMKNLRNAFASVVIAAEIGAGATLLGLAPQSTIVTLVIASVGVAALIPVVYFSRKVRAARAEIKLLKRARREGKIFE
jgi:hypothetical protein